MSRYKKYRFIASSLAIIAFGAMVTGLVLNISSDRADLKIKDRVETNSKVTGIAPGITETELITRDENGENQLVSYITDFDFGKHANIHAAIGYKDMNFSTYGLATVRSHVQVAQGMFDAATAGKTIVSAVNGGSFNMATGRPAGHVIHAGVTYQVRDDTNCSNQAFFGITKSGEPIIGNTDADYNAVKDDLLECVSAMNNLIKDGQKMDHLVRYDDWYEWRAPRTGIGYTKDGHVVTVTIDGRNAPISVGGTYDEMAEILLSKGCYQAIALDGGGSTTQLNKLEGDSVISLRNNPSDGAERKVSTSIFFYVDSAYDGNFTHANVYPKNEYYTPGSVVQFSAKGVDGGGGPAPIPAGAHWAVDDETSGSIDSASGLFTASEDKTGEVEVYLRDANNSNIGSTSIYLYNPTSLVFANAEKSVGFDVDCELGLKAFYNDVQVNFTAEDIVFTLVPDGEGHQASDLGYMNGLTFHSHASNTISGTITAAVKANSAITASMRIIVGAKPTVIDDFESYDTLESLGASWYAYGGGHGYGHGGVNSIAVASYSAGLPVRFGTQSLQMNYDFTKVAGATEGASAGYTTNRAIEGSPTAFGMWVYATEADQGFWLRARIFDGSNTQQQIDLTCQPSTCEPGVKPGINWTGWKYVEGAINPSWSLPLSMSAGEAIRFMYVPGNEMGTPTAGAIYVDNPQFVYGANTDDVDAPVISRLAVNGSLGEEGMTLASNYVNFEGEFFDAKSTFMTGIDFDKIKLSVDGIEYSDSSLFTIDRGAEKVNLTGLVLGDGYHRLKLVVPDAFGNVDSEELGFFLEGSSDIKTAIVQVELDKTIELDGTYDLNLYASDPSQLSGAKLILQLSQLFQDVDVETLNGLTLKREYNQNLRQLTLNFDFSGASYTAGGRTKLGTIKIKVPLSSNINSETLFSLQCLEGSYTLKSDYSELIAEGQALTFSFAPVSLKLEASYEVTNDPIIVGEEAVFRVTSGGLPAAGIDVYSFDGVSSILLGTTDSSGILRIESFKSAIEKFSYYAAKDGDYSFVSTTQSLKALPEGSALPTAISSNLVGDNSTAIDLTWLSNPRLTAETPKVKYALKSEDTVFITASGDSKILPFYGNSDLNLNGAARLNHVRLSGLKPDSRYIYQVGDGTNYSTQREFVTSLAGGKVNFFVVGDAQTADTEKISQIFNRLAGDGKEYSFGIQTGDLIDSISRYDLWDNTLNAFASGGMSHASLLHVLGNHETYGDDEGSYSKSFFQVPDRYHYSMEIGNVYLATISYSGQESSVKESFDWLIEDAKKSQATFKILTIHQPPYYTNPAGGNEYVNKYGPSAVDAAGIDFVFSGHDHSYGRTAPMKGGEIDETGAVYYICGSTGEKSYSADPNPEFNFEIATQEFGSIYLSVSTTFDSMTIDTYDGVTGNRIDTYTKKAVRNQEVHRYIYDGTYLRCQLCGNTFDPQKDSYTGLFTYEDEDVGYFENGSIKRDAFILVGNNYYAFDSDGRGLQGEHFIDGVRRVFDKGLMVDGFTGTIKDEHGLRGYIDGVQQFGLVTIDSEYYYFDLKTGYAHIGRLIYSGVIYDFSDEEDYYGMMIADQFYVTSSGKVKYFYTYGTTLKGVQSLRTDTESGESATCYFDASGYLIAVSGKRAAAVLYELYGAYAQKAGHAYVGSIEEFKAALENHELDTSFLPEISLYFEGKSVKTDAVTSFDSAILRGDTGVLKGTNLPAEAVLPTEGLYFISNSFLTLTRDQATIDRNKKSLEEAIAAVTNTTSTRRILATIRADLDIFGTYGASADVAALEEAFDIKMSSFNAYVRAEVEGASKLIFTADTSFTLKLVAAVSSAVGLLGIVFMLGRWRKM